MAEQLPVNVIVELFAASPVKAKHDFTIKQVYSVLLKSEKQITSDTKLYEASLNNKPSNTSNDNFASPKVPLYLVQNCTLIGNAMIATPSIPNFKYFNAKLKSSNETTFKATYQTGTGGNINVNGEAIYFPKGYKEVKVSTTMHNQWVPTSTTNLSADLVYSPFTQDQNTISCRYKLGNESPRIKSRFSLRQNQPFAVKLNIERKFNSEQESAIKSNINNQAQKNDQKNTKSNNKDNTTEDSTTTVISSEQKLVPWVDIIWGGGSYKISVYADNKISLTINDKLVANKVTFTGLGGSNKDNFSDILSIYPLGSTIYLYKNVPNTKDTVERKYISFNLGEPANIPTGNVELVFNCTFSQFDFSSILHASNAKFQSPWLQVPTGSMGSPTIITNHLGKFGSGPRGNAISLPDKGDRNKFYSYLKDFIGKVPIQIEQASSAGSSSDLFAYQVNLNVKTDLDALDTSSSTTPEENLLAIQENIYSPALYHTNFTFIQPEVEVDSPAYVFNSDDLINVTVNQSVEGQKASVILNNRKVDGTSGGNYPSQDSIFTGIKPIRISAAYGTKDPKVIYTGYTTNWKWARNGATQSILTIQCDDITKKAKEQYAVNLPFFDGWCHLGAMKYLLKQAGYSDNEISLPEDPDIDVTTLEGSCADGHAEKQQGSDYIHAILPLAIIGSSGFSEPAYNFSFGTPLWDCMNRIREFMNWYLYADHLGRVVYGPPSTLIKESGKNFVEVDITGGFNEIHGGIEVTCDTSEMRNVVFLQGNVFIPNDKNDLGGEWATHIHVKSAFPSKQTSVDPFFAPYPRLLFIRNPKFEDINYARAGCVELYRRVTRKRLQVNFSSWGQFDLHPYEVITIDENIMNELGLASNKFVVAAHTIVCDAINHTATSNLNVELLDEDYGTYDPKVIKDYQL